MSVIGSSILAGASGAAGGDPVYVDDVFSTFLWQGTGSSQTINNGIDLAGEGGLVWSKNRGASASHLLNDSERGIESGSYYSELVTNSTAGNEKFTPWGVSSFNSNGFTLGGSNAQFNLSNNNYVSWTFRKAPGWCDIVTWTGNSTARTISHSLASVPGMIIVKVTSGGTDDWFVYHRSLGDQRIKLNSTNASGSTAVWNYTAPTSSVFSVGTDGGVNGSGRTYIAYVFAHDDAQFGTDGDESIIKCGSYTGTGSGGNRVELGFEPQFVMLKSATYSDANTGWYMLDTMRGFNTTTSNAVLQANLSDTENPTSGAVKISGNGFELNFGGSEYNKNTETYIYMAIRRPNKPPEAATDVFALNLLSTPQNSWTPGFVADSMLFTRPSSSTDRFWTSRLQGNKKWMVTNSTAAEPSNSTAYFHYDDPTNTMRQTYIQGGADCIFYALKRAPGFMDVVAFTGTGSATTINHNLGAVPSVVLIKGRNTTYSWYWQHYALGANTWLQLNNTEAGAGNGGVFNSTLPTSSVFSVGSLAGTNGSGNPYIAYLFGDLPGISKAGTYTGTGSALNIDCGFTNGARFVLIKRTDTTGNWYAFDTARGIVSGNDFAYAFNSTASQISGDYIDPLAAGFTINGSYAQWN